MDDRTWYLAIATLAAGVVAVLLDAALGDAFDIPSGFFPMLSAMLGFLGARAAFKDRGAHKEDDS